jgi:hypothetical protein
LTSRQPLTPHGVASRGARTVGAVALLTIGAVHLDEYAGSHYSAIPTIGWLFLMNFIAASAFGLVLLAPAGRPNRRWRHWLDGTAALGGLGVSAGSLVAILVSERMPLFGFMERGYRPIIVFAIAADAVAIVALTAALAWRGGRRAASDGTAILPSHGALALTEGASATARARGGDHGGDLAA